MTTTLAILPGLARRVVALTPTLGNAPEPL
jgi:hypothetical protein